jgi:Flp pilus assembly protein TadD
VSISAGIAIAGLYADQAAQQRFDAESALARGQWELQQHHYVVAQNTFDLALELPGASAVRADLLRGRQLAARAHAIATLHRQMERARYYQDLDLTPATLRVLEEQCRTAWQQRDRLLAAGDDPLDTEMEEQLRRDLLDDAVLLADCQIRLAGPAQLAGARRAALRILDEAKAVFGPSAVLSRRRQALGQPADGDAPPPRTAWEHYLIGRSLLRDSNLPAAAAAFERAVELRPQDFWPWFGKGRCAYYRQRAGEAVTAFTVCIVLAPDSAACYHNRALASAKTDPAAALRDYDKALALDPQLAEAALNRGVLHLQQHRYSEADADLHLARTLGADPAAVRHNLTLVEKARHTRVDAKP